MSTSTDRNTTAGLTPLRPSGLTRWLALLGVWAALGAAVTYVLAFDPTDARADPTGPCTWHALFGIDGPTCGGTRMVWYLLHGDLVPAVRHHLAAFIAVPVVLYALSWWTVYSVSGRRLPSWRPPTWVYFAYGAFFLLYAVVLRNLPWEPFTWFYVDNLTS